MLIVATVVGGLVLGAVMAWLYCRVQVSACEAKLTGLLETSSRLESVNAQLTASNSQLSIENVQLSTSLAEKQQSFEAQVAQLRQNEDMLKDSFARLAKDALDGNSKSFLDLARVKLGEFEQTAKGDLDLRKQEVAALVKPINETLSRFDQTVKDLETRVTRDVEIALLDAQTAYQRLDLTNQLLAQSTDALDLAQQRYDLGLSSIVELTQAQLNKTEAEIAAATARYDYQARLAALRFQTGALK